MDIRNLFEKYNISETWVDRFSKTAKIIMIVAGIILVIISLAYPYMYAHDEYMRKYKLYGAIVGATISFILLFIGFAIASFVIMAIIGLIVDLLFPYNPKEVIFINKKFINNKDKENILSHISQLSNISSIYTYLNLNLVCKKYINGKDISDDEKTHYKNEDAISLLKEISALIKEKKIFPDLNNDDLETVLNHYRNFFLMSESNREIIGLDLESGEVFPKLSEVIEFVKNQNLNFNDFLYFRNQILSSNELSTFFYKEFIFTHLENNGSTYLKENLEEYKNYINVIAEIKNNDDSLYLVDEMFYAITPIYNILNEYPNFLKTNDLISLYHYHVNYKHLELLFNDERFNSHDKPKFTFSFFWDYDSVKKVGNIINKCQNIDTLNQLLNDTNIRNEFYLITEIIAHPLMKDNNFSELLNSLLDKHWNNYTSLEHLLSNKLSVDLGVSTYRNVQSRITELKRDEKLMQNSDEVKNSQLRAEQIAIEQAESQRRQEQYQRIQAENSRIAAQNSRIAAQNSRIAAESAQQAQRNTERR
ncbi:hypothetical protein [Aliarcobacter cryaerophilus]|uniref:hypothetical protein n=1 Tax=Aliarcobacter cryaerophilus TaxID=28198 RepID=UPI003DA55A34